MTLPRGYRRTGRGDEIELIDPATCPSGHPWRPGQRGYAPCAPHRGHPAWTCACGRVQYGDDGQFVEQLACR